MHFSTRSFSRDQSVAPLTPLRKARDTTHWLPERKPFLLIEHLLLYIYMFYPSRNMVTSLYALIRFPSVWRIHSAIIGSGSEMMWHSLHETQPLLFSALNSLQFRQSTSFFIWLSFRASTCHLDDIWFLLLNPKYLVYSVVLFRIQNTVIFSELYYIVRRNLTFVSCFVQL